MLRRFDDHRVIGARVDADRAENIGVDGLQPLARRHQIDIAEAEQRRIAHRPGPTLDHLPRIRRQANDARVDVQRRARQGRTLAANTHGGARALPQGEGVAHGERVPERPDGDAAGAGLHQGAHQEGRIARRPATRVVGDVGQHQRTGLPGRGFGGRGDRVSDAGQVRQGAPAQVEQGAAEILGDASAQHRPASGIDQHLGAHVRRVAPGKAVHQRDRHHAVPPLQRPHGLDETLHRLAIGEVEAEHPAVEHRGHRRRTTGQTRAQQFDRRLGALEHVGVRIFLEEDQDRRVVGHRRGQVGVRVQHRADGNIRPDQGAHPGQDIAFAVVAARRDHGAVQGQGDHVHRHRLGQVRQQRIAQRLIDRLGHDTAGRGPGAQALRQAPTVTPAALPEGLERQRPGRLTVEIERAGRLEQVRAEALHIRGDRRKDIGFRRDRPGENLDVVPLSHGDHVPHDHSTDCQSFILDGAGRPCQ